MKKLTLREMEAHEEKQDPKGFFFSPSSALTIQPLGNNLYNSLWVQQPELLKINADFQMMPAERY